MSTSVADLILLVTNATTREVLPRISDSASGILSTVRNVGQVLGIAVLGSLLQTWVRTETESNRTNANLPLPVKDEIARLSGEGRLDVIPQVIPADQQAHLAAVFDSVQRAFVDAMQYMFLASAGILLAAAATALLIRNVVPVTRLEPEPEPVAEMLRAERPQATPATTGE